jgi:preprotein translocase subunit SecE
MTQKDADLQPKTLGLLRWVQCAFMAAAVFLFWFLDKIAVLLWGMLSDVWMSLPEAESVSTIITAASGAVAAAVVWRLYVDERVNRLAHEVVGELSKVTWPSRREVSYSTVVVIITSIIAAVILGTFDAVWSAITDLIYTV